MKKKKPLDYKQLRKEINPSELKFKNTDEISSHINFIGQDRAKTALFFGIGIKGDGFNLYAMGPTGLGKRSILQILLEKEARKQNTPSDWCYIHNFEMPEKPIALELPAGLGNIFKKDMCKLMQEIAVSVVTIFESDEYRIGMKKIKFFYENKRKKLLNKNLNSKLDKTPQLYKKQHEKENKFQLTFLSTIIKPIFKKLIKKYRSYSEIIKYLNAVQEDIIYNVDDFIKEDEKTNLLSFTLEKPAFTKYKVNVLVDNTNIHGAPIIFENHPSYSTLICRVEHVHHQGSLSTNFTLIKSGSLHQANGGYLMMEARKVIKNREAWESLKNALFSKKITIKPIERNPDSAKPISLEPMEIPLNIKIILLGDRNTYYSLCQHDEDFIELFKVPVDFDEEIDRTPKNIYLFCKLIKSIAERNQLTKPFHASAVIAIIEYCSRIAEDAEKLSTHISTIEDVILEAYYWASKKNKKIVRAEDVNYSIESYAYRINRAKELYHESIHRNFIIINTTGSTIGQVNCLSVRRVGTFAYGHPTRVTARVRFGKGKVIDIQREIKMAGPLHSKAGLIISNFLASRFNKDYPFSIYASIAFEQVYVWTDGDSASVGELCALLSALSRIPIFQFLSVTGSIDQYGEVQSVGGINEKIEGFYDVCKKRGLNGKQGVLIPAVNSKNLMLRNDIVRDAKEKRFFIYPIQNIDDAIYLLTGKIPGKRNPLGKFPKDTVYGRIEEQLFNLANKEMKQWKK